MTLNPIGKTLQCIIQLCGSSLDQITEETVQITNDLIETIVHVLKTQGMPRISQSEIKYILTTLDDLVKVEHELTDREDNVLEDVITFMRVVPLPTSETKQLIAELVLTTLPESGTILRAHDYLIIFLSSHDPHFIKSLVERADPSYL